MKQLQEFADSDNLSPSVDIPVKKIGKLPLPYTGNKKKLVYLIYNTLIKYDVKFDSVLDAFAGSGSVSLLFKLLGKRVFSNDLLTSSYLNSVTFVENPGVRISEEEKHFLLYNQNSNKNTFVEDNYLGTQFRAANKECRFNKFTLKECQHLDNFRANVDDLGELYSQSLSMIANAAVIMRLPFGNVDQSNDIMSHRKRQQEYYGKGSKKHDRRIGIYYNEEMNLNFNKWFSKYADDFMLSLTSVDRDLNAIKDKRTPFLDNLQQHADEQHLTTNMHITDLLWENGCSVDCAYFDPPYGGPASDYATIYRFLEEYIYSEKLENLPHISVHKNDFVKKENYEDSFVGMLNTAQHIPIWMFSYNNNSWKDVEYICGIIRQFKKDIIIETLTNDYRYFYRKKKGRTKKSSEYLIIAR